MKAHDVGFLLVLSILAVGVAGCSGDGSSGSALGIGGGTGSQTPVFTQADLTGSWDMMVFRTSTQPPGGGWFRLVMRFDANGHLIVDDNTTFQTTVVGDSVDNGDTGWIMTVNSAGVVSYKGDPSISNFHGYMASNKQVIVSTSSFLDPSGSPRNKGIWILRKRVPGVAYDNTDLFNKSFVAHGLQSGGFPKWMRGDGLIDSTGSVTLKHGSDSTGHQDTNIDNVAKLAVSPEGVVTNALVPDFKGFLTPDKKILIGTGTDPGGQGGTNYELNLFTISGQTFAQSDLAGTWKFTQINCGTESEWAYGVLTANPSGNATLTLAARSDNGSLTPVTYNFSLGPSGILVPTADPTSTFQGVMSYNKDFVFVTDTGQSGGVFTLSILMK